jgi:hypothetical protein
MDFEPDCRARQQHTLQLIGEMRPEVLVVANNSPLAISTFTGATENTDVYTPASKEALASWESALRTTFTDVQPSVDRVVLFSVIPSFRNTDFDRALVTLLRPNGAFPTESVATVQRPRGPILDAERRASEGLSVPVTIVDPLATVCPDGECGVRFADGRYRYRDPNHLSRIAVRSLTDLIREALVSDP